jgi:uncharacterized membrane protein
MARHQSPGLARGARFGALLSLLMLVTLETRKAFQGPYLASSEVGFAEWGGLVVAWLALAALLVAAEGRFPGHDLARFGHAVLVLALLGLLAGPLTAANPLWTHLGVGSLPVVNLLLWVYGAPALLLAWHARAAGRLKRAGLARAAGGAALVLLLVLVTLEVRQAFRGPFLDVPAIGFAEWGGLVVAWLALAALLVAAEGRAPGHDLERFGHAVLVLALLGLLAGPLSAANPLWAHLEVGSLPVVNLLLWVYGAPALLLAWHARAAGRRGRRELSRAAASAALLLLFVLVTLEVRQAFRGAILDGLAAGHGERYAYSAAWVALGIGLLVAGIVGPGGRALRLAALAVMTLAVGKVFLYDTAHLTDLYRVLSFLGLGLSLLLLAWLYQRFVFRTPAAPL